ncbi:unnamed protein product [Dicrocoelium dendriticum]|nr:unnamed protein product [Dicrocoelium dendriticum]
MSESGYGSRGEYVANHVPNDAHRVQRLQDGTIEIVDNLPKQEYYRSLRRPMASESVDNGLAATGLASQLSLDIAQSGGTLLSGLGKKNATVLDYKPSGHEELCHVLMLEGVEKTFSIDRNAYGIHLFEKVCRELDLRETEYFGMTYRGAPRTDYWLKMNKRLSKQLEKKPWKLEFHIRHYPLDIDELKDDLTRYCLCLQIRQDIISGQLPCSFQVYVILGAYAVQSEAGDYDPDNHVGIEYISNIPFAPQSLQTSQMLQRITELHKLHKGHTPVQADRGFLENARRLALYGVEFHNAKTPLDEDVSIGVYHSGILVYRGRIRIGRFLWPQLVQLSHKSRTFSMCTRAVNISPKIRAAFLLKNNGSTSGSGLLSAKRKSAGSKDQQDLHQVCTLNFQFAEPRLAKRLWESCTSQHAFFRLREPPGPRRPNLTSAFNTRKYHYSDKGLTGSQTMFPPNDWPTGRPQPAIQRVPTQRKPAHYASTPLATPHVPRRPSSGVAPVVSNADPDQFYIIPGSPAPLPADSVDVTLLQSMPPAYRKPGPIRAPLAQEYWRMSPADCTPCLGMNIDGTDVAAMADTDWQGCRTNRGLKWPGAYFYEVVVMEEGALRLGWSTNDASLLLGTDSKGFGYGVNEIGCSTTLGSAGLLYQDKRIQEYGCHVVPGDVIGCYLELNAGTGQFSAQWSHNGRMFGPAPLPNPYAISPDEPLFPAASLKDARIVFNFGYKPFRFPPKQPSSTGEPWIPVSDTPDALRVPNLNVGWRVNPADVSSKTNLLISPNGRMVQALANTGWQGFRVNKGIFGGGKYYYEVKVVEDSGLARVGWSSDGASLDLGTDCFGYGFGADRDGFGITGTQGKKLHADMIENYGEAFGKDDVIGCFLDLDTGVIQWSKNGRLFGNAYWLPEKVLRRADPIFPAASLVDTTLELNYGDLPFEYPPEGDWLPMFAAPDESVTESASWQNQRAVERQERDIHKSHFRLERPEVRPTPPLRSSSRLGEDGEPLQIIVADTGIESPTPPDEDEVHTFTEAESEEAGSDSLLGGLRNPMRKLTSVQYAATERRENEITTTQNGITACEEADRALNAAIFETTRFNPHISVLTDSIGLTLKSNGHL